MLNSRFVQWLIQWGFSNSGVVVRWIVGGVIAWLAGKNIFPADDLESLRVSWSSALSGVFAVAYGFFQFWLNSRQRTGIQVVQRLVGKQEITGTVGNGTIEAVALAAGAEKHEVRRAIAVVRGT
jgi:hypothetical protein